MKNDPEFKKVSKNENLNDSSNISEKPFLKDKSPHQIDSVDLWFRRISQWAMVGGTGIASIFFSAF